VLLTNCLRYRIWALALVLLPSALMATLLSQWTHSSTSAAYSPLMDRLLLTGREGLTASVMSLLRIWNHKCLSIPTIICFFPGFVLSIFLNASETWTLCVADTKQSLATSHDTTGRQCSTSWPSVFHAAALRCQIDASVGRLSSNNWKRRGKE